MVGEHFEIHLSQMAKNAPKLSTMFGETFEICWSEMVKNVSKLSTRVGENFEIHLSEMDIQECKKKPVIYTFLTPLVIFS